MGISTTHEMPSLCEFLFVEEQDGVACAWFLVEPTGEKRPRKFKIYGTGHDIPISSRYLGTFQSPPYVWHLFEESE